MSKMTKDQRIDFRMTASFFDRVSATLIATILIVASLVLVMFSLWMSYSNSESSQPFQEGLLFPTDFPESPEPVTADDWDESAEDSQKLEDALTAIPKLTRSLYEAHSGAFGFSMRMITIPPDPVEVPEHQRWSIKYQAADLDEYAEQLDFFGIELGAIHETDVTIIRLSLFSGEKPLKTESTRERENGRQTIYFVPESERLLGWDWQLAGRAGITDDFHGLVHFPRESTLDEMRAAEQKYLDDHKIEINDVKKIEFEVVAKKNSWQMQISNVVLRDRTKQR